MSHSSLTAEVCVLTSQQRVPSQVSSVPVRIVATCLTAVMVACHFTNASSLLATIQTQLHISSGQAGLFSTLLFAGLALAYIPAGMLGDRFGPRPVALWSCILMTAGAMALPLFPNVTWMLICRMVVGVGSGGAIIMGAGVASGLGRSASLGQGLYGGATQVGSGLGLLITPHLLALFGWRGSFLFWGLLGTLTIFAWLFINDGSGQRPSGSTMAGHLGTAVRSPAVWTLGLSHMGTFGLGNVIAAWITLYLTRQYGLPLTFAATIGSCGLLAGMFIRPLGGILIARRVISAISLLRLGTLLGCLGVGLLVIPLRFPPCAVVGMVLIAIGSTLPYTAVFNTAADLQTVSKGMAQGLVSVISCPAVLLGPPLIGFLLDQTRNFTAGFGVMVLFGCVAVLASFLAGPAVLRESRV